MNNRIRSLKIWNSSVNPAEAGISISVQPEQMTSTTQVRGRVVGPRCVYSSTVEVAYPMREVSRQYEKYDVPGLILRVVIPEPCLWDPQSPFVYEVAAELWQSGQLCDQVRTSHCLYSLKLTPQGLRWNGRPMALSGVELSQLTEPEASELRQAGRNTVLAQVTAETAALCNLADRLGLFVLARLASRGDYAQARALKGHVSLLGFVLDSRLLEDPLVKAWPTWIADQDQLMGLEIDEPPPEALLEGFSFLLTREDARQNLSRAKLPLLIRRSKRDGGKEEPVLEANSLGSIYR
ncbi:MAG TPA: hypothetical protein VG099_22390 [Gemmataceae bacterium]|jgi:hypothetical protein|nr:hypothetical protein [Gemmataceae bacterium]